MSRKCIFTLFLISLLVATGCRNIEDFQKEQTFGSMFPDIPMNVSLMFLEPASDFLLNGPVSLDLENTSSDEIGIPFKEGIVAISFIDGKWSPLSNKATYFPSNGIRFIFPKGPNAPGVAGISLMPQFEPQVISKYIRVVVVGFVYKDGQKTGRKTGSFIDIVLNP